MAVGGLAGGVRSAMDGKETWTAVGIFGVGFAGVVLAVAWIVTYATGALSYMRTVTVTATSSPVESPCGLRTALLSGRR